MYTVWATYTTNIATLNKSTCINSRTYSYLQYLQQIIQDTYIRYSTIWFQLQ